MPGVIVALFGLYAAHLLACRRDRRKSVEDLCAVIIEAAQKAVESAELGWLSEPGTERVTYILTTKRRLQFVGMSATTLRMLSQKTARYKPIIERLKQRQLLARYEIDISKEVARLRRAATGDPFEDPMRQASDTQIEKIRLALGHLMTQVDRLRLQAH